MSRSRRRCSPGERSWPWRCSRSTAWPWRLLGFPLATALLLGGFLCVAGYPAASAAAAHRIAAAASALFLLFRSVVYVSLPLGAGRSCRSRSGLLRLSAPAERAASMLEQLALGLGQLATLANLAVLALGLLVGMLVAILPGLTLVMGVALALPFTYRWA